MHDASLPNLLAVVDHYNALPAIVTGLDPRLTRPGGPGAPPQPQRLNFTQTEKDNLVAFLLTLTGSSVYTDEKWSDPFETDGSLPFVVLPTESMTVAVGVHDPTTKLGQAGFEVGHGQAVPFEPVRCYIGTGILFDQEFLLARKSLPRNVPR